jgi:hypothetical protein
MTALGAPSVSRGGVLLAQKDSSQLCLTCDSPPNGQAVLSETDPLPGRLLKPSRASNAALDDKVAAKPVEPATNPGE